MAKITFLGAGSTVFAKNVLGDCLTRDSLRDSHIALYDIDASRLRESKRMLDTLNKNISEVQKKELTSEELEFDTHFMLLVHSEDLVKL